MVSGVFAGSDRLAQAEAEAEALESTFNGIPIQAADAEVIAGLSQQQPPFDVFHFAVHGDFSAGDTEGTAGPIRPRILFADGTSLSENAIRGLEPLPGTPFVFLNACQLGAVTRCSATTPDGGRLPVFRRGRRRRPAVVGR